MSRIRRSSLNSKISEYTNFTPWSKRGVAQANVHVLTNGKGPPGTSRKRWPELTEPDK